MIRVLNEASMDPDVLSQTDDERIQQYTDYLINHISNVLRVYKEFFADNIANDSNLNEYEIIELEHNILNHDRSKYSKEEFMAYLNNFYPLSEQAKIDNEDNYDYAWNHHQKTNPHHWQYYILRKDSGETKILPMKEIHVIEMLCDWSSFRYKNGTSTANSWYANNKDKMLLHENTKAMIEYYLGLYEDL